MMIMLHKLAIRVAFVAGVVMPAPAALSYSGQERVARPSSPPLTCEIRQRAWCIVNGTAEITEVQPLVSSDPPGRAWTLKDTHFPASTLVILEPTGCRQSLADTLSATGFKHGFTWRDKSWDEVGLRLRSDGSCDLKLLVPPYNEDPLEWAFSQGRLLIWACKDEACNPTSPTPADVTRQYEDEFEGKKKK